MFENKFVSLPSHLKTIESMEVHRELRTMCNTDTIDANYPQRDFHTMYVGKIENVLVRDDEYLK